MKRRGLNPFISRPKSRIKPTPKSPEPTDGTQGAWVVMLALFVVFVFIFGVTFVTFESFRAKAMPQFVIVDAKQPPITCREEDLPEDVPIVKMNVRATAYSSTPDQTDSSPCITATGFDVCKNYALYGSVNTVASNLLPMHTVLKIPELFGDRLFVVRDRMNARYGAGQIDLWLPTRSEAQKFGARYLEIQLIKSE